MKQVLLLCAAGLTTSMLKRRLEKLIEEKKIDIKMNTAPIAEVAYLGEQADILVLSPQVRFNHVKIQQMFPNKTIIQISEENYKSLNANEIIQQIIKEI